MQYLITKHWSKYICQKRPKHLILIQFEGSSLKGQGIKLFSEGTQGEHLHYEKKSTEHFTFPQNRRIQINKSVKTLCSPC